jgi:hypothetical protein
MPIEACLARSRLDEAACRTAHDTAKGLLAASERVERGDRWLALARSGVSPGPLATRQPAAVWCVTVYRRQAYGRATEVHARYAHSSRRR